MIRPDVATFSECVKQSAIARNYRAKARDIRANGRPYLSTHEARESAARRMELRARKAELIVRIAADAAIGEAAHFGPWGK